MSLNLFVLLNLFLKMYCQVANSLFSVGFEMAPFQNLVFVHPKFAFASQALKQCGNGNLIKSLPKNCRAQNISPVFPKDLCQCYAPPSLICRLNQSGIGSEQGTGSNIEYWGLEQILTRYINPSESIHHVFQPLYDVCVQTLAEWNINRYLSN